MSDTGKYGALVESLAVPHRARPAYWALIAAGSDALPAVRAGLQHANADVRHHCCRYLDHFVDSESVAELLTMLDDGDPHVRSQALHALACDRCKEGTCRPDEALVLPRALALLRNDPDHHVRNHAAGVVGLSVHRNSEAAAAIAAAVASDPHPAVRKKAAWYAPGGPLFKKTAPREPRVKREAAA